MNRVYRSSAAERAIVDWVVEYGYDLPDRQLSRVLRAAHMVPDIPSRMRTLPNGSVAMDFDGQRRTLIFRPDGKVKSADL